MNVPLNVPLAEHAVIVVSVSQFARKVQLLEMSLKKLMDLNMSQMQKNVLDAASVQVHAPVESGTLYPICCNIRHTLISSISNIWIGEFIIIRNYLSDESFTCA